MPLFKTTILVAYAATAHMRYEVPADSQEEADAKAAKWAAEDLYLGDISFKCSNPTISVLVEEPADKETENEMTYRSMFEVTQEAAARDAAAAQERRLQAALDSGYVPMSVFDDEDDDGCDGCRDCDGCYDDDDFWDEDEFEEDDDLYDEDDLDGYVPLEALTPRTPGYVPGATVRTPR